MDIKAFIKSGKTIGIALLIVAALISWTCFVMDLSTGFFDDHFIAIIVGMFFTLLPVIIILWYIFYRCEKLERKENDEK